MKKLYCLIGGLIFASMAMNAQQLKPGYLTPPSSHMLHKYVNDWEPGKELTTNYKEDGKSERWEDEEFFVSRVALKPYFVNKNTQIDKTKPDSENKKLLFWAPINEYTDENNVWLNALPNAVHDSEVFSTWSYVTHYSNRHSPFGWVPAAMADAAHKNGVLVSGVASMPNNVAIPANWADCLGGLGAMNNDAGVEKLGRFLRYHGVDGLSYNSAYSNGAGLGADLRGVHGKLVKWMKQYQSGFENVWNGVTDDNGRLNNSSQLSPDYYQTFGYADEPRTSMLLNYYWNSVGDLNTTANGIGATGRDSRDVYTGIDMHANLRTGSEWMSHLSIPYSIGLCGVYHKNYIWAKRVGESDAARQDSYQKLLENWFTNGKRNPLYNIDPVYKGSFDEKFMGMSRYMEARSTLKWDLSTEPFVTYFNVGGGSYYNWKGAQVRVAPWYNLGVQDYMPTWRFWFATEYLGTTPSENVDANITWKDAYMGGSSLRLTANNKEASYLHLFKTEFDAKNNTKFTIRYKVLNGSGDVKLVWSKLGSESTEAQGDYGMLFDKNGKTYSSTKPDGELTYYSDWQYKTITMTSRNNLTGIISAIALKIENAKDLEFLIGEISLTNGNYSTPAAPIVTRAKVLANNHKGVDGKIYYKMSNTKEPGEPVYNLDVKTSLFRLWSRTDVDAEPHFLGTTSSWAGMIFSAPAQRAGKVQFGVSAVSLDFAHESEIAWSDAMPVGDYEEVEDLYISKSPLTTGEEFYVEFVDEEHHAVDWKITDEGGGVVAEARNSMRIDVPGGIDRVGSYDVYAGDVKHSNYISVSKADAGRQPIIESLTVNGEEAWADGVKMEVGRTQVLGYTGRVADGAGSRGVRLNEYAFGVKVEDLGLGEYESFSVAFWLKLDKYPKNAPGSLLLIENREGGWPKNNWGFFWNRTVEGSLRNHKIDGGWGKSLDGGADGMRLYCDYDANLGTAKWNHLVYVFEYNDHKRVRMKFYLNGVLQNISKWLWCDKGNREEKIGSSVSGWEDIALTPDYESLASGLGGDVTETDWCLDNYPLNQNDWIKVGGNGPNGMEAVDGVIDDFQVWGKAMTQEDVELSKNGLGRLETLPEAVIAYWSMEEDADEYYKFVSQGREQADAYLLEYVPSEVECQCGPTVRKPVYEAGSPFVDGEAYKVVTTPEWTAPRGVFTDAEGGDTNGSVKISYDRNDVGNSYIVTLTLANALGKDMKSYPVIKVHSAIDGVETDGTDMKVYTMDKTMFLEFAEGGAYEVSVYNMSGMLVGSDARSINAGEIMHINIGQAGVYVVSIVKDGKELRSIKVVNK
ncbi:MAG: T9SS type A sorting domain-containing protein [Paramuribaculum sp.]|nr:T9SS type A sorting domain-containing protein [Paramuribaculum sp.]